MTPALIDSVEGELVEDPVSLIGSSGFVKSLLCFHELVRFRQPLCVRDVDLENQETTGRECYERSKIINSNWLLFRTSSQNRPFFWLTDLVCTESTWLMWYCVHFNCWFFDKIMCSKNAQLRNQGNACRMLHLETLTTKSCKFNTTLLKILVKMFNLLRLT